MAGQAPVSHSDSPAALEQAIERYNEAWNDHDVEAIMAMHAPDMVFHNHTAGESAQGEDVRGHLAVDLRDVARHPLRDAPPLRQGRPRGAGVDGDRHPHQHDAPRRHRRGADRPRR